MHHVPAPLLFLLSGVSQYLGAAFAVGLFDTASAVSVGWARVAVAAVLLVLWSRPWRTRWTRQTLLACVLFGVVLATMNLTFYAALEHLPLGNAVAIEFLGPVAVAALTGKGVRERVAIALALCGVVLLAGVTVSGGGEGAVVGLLLVLAAAAAWAGYIVLGRRVSAQGTGLAPLALAMVAGALVFAPVAGPGALPLLGGWQTALVLVGVAVASSMIPYGIDQVVLRRLRPAQFAILLAILPVSALIVGVLVLGQVPRALEVVGLVLVCVAIALTSRPGRPEPAPSA